MRRLLGFLALLAALAVASLGALAFTVQRSLAPSRETVAVAGWPAGGGDSVRIDLDGLGVPTVLGSTEAAVAFGQGYAHARDRRFQMELFRRTAAGRLSELVGAPALPSDRWFRTLGFAAVADSGIARLGPERRALFEAYAAGVNAYDATHPAPPEFLVLGVTPEPWRPRDTGLVALLMQQDQGWDAADDERARELMEATLPEAVVDFLLPAVTRWDAAFADGPMPPRAATPDSATFDARGLAARAGAEARHAAREPGETREARGSNSWVVAGARTRSGRPLLANDPHMTLRVPAIWHRERLVFPGCDVTGVSLPGVPGIACGTNGAVAWGMTNPSADLVDLVRCRPDPADTTRFLGPAGPEPFGARREVIAVKNGASDTLVVRTTRFGPVVGPSASREGGWLAAQWTALDPRTLDTDLFGLDRAPSVAAFLAALDGYRGPQMSIVVADSAGAIAWKVGGMLPRRDGARSDRPRDATDPGAAWRAELDPAANPSLVDPASGMLYAANQRVVGGAAWDALRGRAGAPWRARRIAAVLAAAPPRGLDVAAMVALQNDLDASYLEPTAHALTAALADPPPGAAGGDTLARVRALVVAWDRRADSTSVAQAYLVQARAALAAVLTEPIVAPCVARDSAFVFDDPLTDEVVARLLDERPRHLLAPRFATWDDAVREAARVAAARLGARAPGTPFDRIPWGRVNRADVAHPLGAVSPALARRLDMPKAALSGGSNVVRVMRPRHGASMRMVVDLADAARSRFALPGGQSGHFRSPHYGDGFDGWWRGETVPLAAGPATGSIVLVPAATARR